MSASVFTGCKAEDDDDENGMISGSNNNYSISYTNSTTDTSRGYNATTFKHRGALTQITFNKDSLENNGAMSVIWDLESNSSRTATEPRNFNIAGLRIIKDGSSYYAQPYVSVYKNVVDIQAENFGVGKSITATTGKNSGTPFTAEETEIIKLVAENQFAVTPDSTTGAVTVTIDAVEEKSGDNYTGSYTVKFYAGAYDSTSVLNATAAKTATITAAQMGYKTYDASAPDKTNMLGSDNRLPQHNSAVYANVYANKTCSGSWKFVKTYSSAEVIEE